MEVKNLNKEQRISLAIEKAIQKEELELQNKNENGCVLIVKITCSDNMSVRKISDSFENMLQNYGGFINDMAMKIMDESAIENLYLHMDIHSIKFFGEFCTPRRPILKNDTHASRIYYCSMSHKPAFEITYDHGKNGTPIFQVCKECYDTNPAFQVGIIKSGPL
ncbi:hypothetical protein [Candidatus Nitrosotenuis aquarius]|uniref:hypothetical protein n=1 Tax=Candidatus Nitrosotenuis aquarius TaxID=1846278 RepID=UPI0013C2C478|nr:hypothetical protein [Candidatus Nitrosotenuis aquarius]